MPDAAVERLRQQLVQLGQDFLCNTVLPAPVVQVRFIGILHGNEVVWDMTLATLAAWREQGPAPCPFIEISPPQDGEHSLAVGLALSQIDLPAVLKTLVMVRKYKRLAFGRHDFCQQA